MAQNEVRDDIFSGSLAVFQSERVASAGRLFHWMELYSFWFDEKWGYKMLVISTRLPFPSQIRAVLHEVSEEKVKAIIGHYLLYLEAPPKNWADDFSNWLNKKIPLEASN